MPDVEHAVRPRPDAGVDLFWIPLGAGGSSVRRNGLLFEAIAAARQRRPRLALLHAALVVELDGVVHTIEVAPSPDRDRRSRGVVASGAVGHRAAGRLRAFRYEVRCWRGGCIGDLDAAVGPAHRLTDDPRLARRVLGLAAAVPCPVWGRDELGAGEMWTSNSTVSWIVSRAGLPTEGLRPPVGTRAPGWDAGLVVAAHRSTHPGGSAVNYP
jgi:hypothetical protein